MKSIYQGGENIKQIPIRIPDDLHLALKIQTATENSSIQEYVLDLINKDQEQRKQKDSNTEK